MGGLAEYFEIDSTLLRVIWIVILITTGVLPGIIAYIIAALIMPDRPIILAQNQNSKTV
ncbi:MAG: PspC domain-containing protein [Candidatus Harrisonbacteria bacterium CG10_big_fil_rev_8_21_14_0_10_45_28]|uniref:PspC domain-containing protein n=1 Tax=Candidatus Harrisonbacteria bacterium CG10_big_fil_rev_8_21_14_0_10_45_28 TaxID=1974586 RepID=A0A2H0URC9_9BACT|nr:MAG: PspC domain-containing protein [Candidatus Harrisonbacteria bacterium CG10_big_fil_rev_8_21_14_0_10_45_28]